ncbi:Gephyrin [Brachionus plicatilis]|uniref:Gephyrin n=1 Tax=Brachionus plicatilis TaxID=10195 RepID=A0A3M7QVB2_BRAPC|nr:Gephyrin [Brachionus plicatilis]
MCTNALPKQLFYQVGILVVSDSCASNEATDKSGSNLKSLVNDQAFLSTVFHDIVPDSIPEIKKKLIEWSDSRNLSLILTTGGTGFSPRDVTPEATKEVIEKEAMSLTNTILTESMKITKFAMLSRAISGIRKKTLIINLPGSKKGSQEAFEIVLPVLKHALDLINDANKEIKMDHVKIQSEPVHHHEPKSRVCEKDILDKPRSSVYPMISVDEATKIIQHQTQILETEFVFFLNALNRVSAEDVAAQDPLPPFAASVKDGFGLKLTAEQKDYLSNKITSANFVFDVIGSSNAGDNTLNIDLKEGQCVKINTGAPVPLNCDLVIQIEDTMSIEKDEYNRDKRIEIVSTSGCGGSHSSRISLKMGQDIRPIGFDIKKGEVVVKNGSILKAAQIGICATVGALNLKVYKQPIVGLVSTGNELVNPQDVELNSGKIRDSNKSLLFCAVKNLGIDKIFDSGIASDNADELLKVFTNALENSDVVISTGGDLVKDVLEKDLNCTIHFARMNMKPGKPTTFATCEYKGRKKLIFALPGNPVSAIVTFNLVVVPCLKKMMGFENPFWSEIFVKIEFDADLDPRPEYHRSLLKYESIDANNYFSALSTGNQHSSRLLSMNDANALVILPPKTVTKPKVLKGEYLKALLIDKI